MKTRSQSQLCNKVLYDQDKIINNEVYKKVYIDGVYNIAYYVSASAKIVSTTDNCVMSDVEIIINKESKEYSHFFVNDCLKIYVVGLVAMYHLPCYISDYNAHVHYVGFKNRDWYNNKAENLYWYINSSFVDTFDINRTFNIRTV